MKLAARGQRDMDEGPEHIKDPLELSSIRRQARGVYLKSWITAFILAIMLTLL